MYIQLRPTPHARLSRRGDHRTIEPSDVVITRRDTLRFTPDYRRMVGGKTSTSWTHLRTAPSFICTIPCCIVFPVNFHACSPRKVHCFQVAKDFSISRPTVSATVLVLTLLFVPARLCYTRRPAIL